MARESRLTAGEERQPWLRGTVLRGYSSDSLTDKLSFAAPTDSRGPFQSGFQIIREVHRSLLLCHTIYHTIAWGNTRY
jgi:hypothetical protein